MRNQPAADRLAAKIATTVSHLADHPHRGRPGYVWRGLRARPEGFYLLAFLVVPLVLNAKMGTWQVQEAKTRLSEVIERARTEGPQMITRHGAERAVVISIEDYRALVAHKPDFKSYLLGGPKVDDFTIERDRDTGRPVEL